MSKVKCQHCGYVWDYRGKGAFYTTCPRCRFKVKLPEGAKERGPESQPEQQMKLTGMGNLVNKVLEEFGYDRTKLIQILLRLQKGLGWLPMEVLFEVSKQLNVPLSNVYRIVTFYKAFTLSPRGRNLIRVCMGTSCQVRGSQMILERIMNLLGISPGETTPDLQFTLETVNCLGCCAIGPVIMINDDYYGNLTPASVAKLLEKFGVKAAPSAVPAEVEARVRK
ncbi:MAG: NADH-quinone oxidoreductase subunit NuoE [Candidatus Hadarchaeales archaeon]